MIREAGNRGPANPPPWIRAGYFPMVERHSGRENFNLDKPAVRIGWSHNLWDSLENIQRLPVDVTRKNSEQIRCGENSVMKSHGGWRMTCHGPARSALKEEILVGIMAPVRMPAPKSHRPPRGIEWNVEHENQWGSGGHFRSEKIQLFRGDLIVRVVEGEDADAFQNPAHHEGIGGLIEWTQSLVNPCFPQFLQSPRHTFIMPVVIARDIKVVLAGLSQLVENPVDSRFGWETQKVAYDCEQVRSILLSQLE